MDMLWTCRVLPNYWDESNLWSSIGSVERKNKYNWLVKVRLDLERNINDEKVWLSYFKRD